MPEPLNPPLLVQTKLLLPVIKIHLLTPDPKIQALLIKNPPHHKTLIPQTTNLLTLNQKAIPFLLILKINDSQIKQD